MIFLQGSLPIGSLGLFSVRRVGRNFGLPTYCPFCEAKPSADLPKHRTDFKRRWRAAYLAVHIKKGGTPEDFRPIEGDLRRTHD
jgi:hypothetical protein